MSRFSIDDINSAKLPIEFAAISVHILALVCLLIVGFMKLHSFLKSRTWLRFYPVLLVFSFFTFQLMEMLNSYYISNTLVWGITGALVQIDNFLYSLYQIKVWDEIGGKFIMNRYMIPMTAIVTIVVFCLCCGSTLFRYILYNPNLIDPHSVWATLANLFWVWNAYLLILDVGINIYLVRLMFFHLKRTNEKMRVQQSTGFIFVLIALVVGSEVAAIVFLNIYSSLITGDEASVRTGNALLLMCSSCTVFHVAIAVIFFSFILSRQSKDTTISLVTTERAMPTE